MVCALCSQSKQLEASHIIPEFVGKWLKHGSPNGYLREPSNPNVRRQDLPTVRLLCHECEQRFATWERLFAERIFFLERLEPRKARLPQPRFNAPLEAPLPFGFQRLRQEAFVVEVAPGGLLAHRVELGVEVLQCEFVQQAA